MASREERVRRLSQSARRADRDRKRGPLPADPAPPAAAAPGGSPWVWPLALLALAAATLAAFAGVLRNGWIFYDDPRYVYENPLVRHGWNWPSAIAFLHTPH